MKADRKFLRNRLGPDPKGAYVRESFGDAICWNLLHSGLPSSSPLARKHGSCRNSAASRNLSSARACGNAAASIRRSREWHPAGRRSRRAISRPDSKRKNLSILPGACRFPASSFSRNGFNAGLKPFTARRHNWTDSTRGEERFSAASNGRMPCLGFAAPLSKLTSLRDQPVPESPRKACPRSVPRSLLRTPR